MKRRSRLLLIALFIGWLFAVFGGFYLVQKPFTPAAAGAMANALLDLLAAGWIGLLGLGLGQRLLYWLKICQHSRRGKTGRPEDWKAGRPETRPSSNLPPFQPSPVLTSTLSTGESLILGSGLGLGGLGLLALGLGLAGLFYGWLFIAISLVLSFLLWSDWLALLRRLGDWPPPEDRPPRIMAVYVMAIGFFTLTAALLPPIDWDGLFYHLTGPKIFIQAHRISPGIDVPHFNFPFLMEMLFTYAMLLRGDIAAKLIHALYGLLLAGLVYLTARRHLSREAAWPAALVFLSMPMVVTLAGWAYNDLALAFYQLAALYTFLRSQKPVVSSQISDFKAPIENRTSKIQNPFWLVLSGIFAGLAMGLKYTSFVCPLIIGLVLIWRQVARGQWRETSGERRVARDERQVAGNKLQVAEAELPQAVIAPSIHNSAKGAQAQFTIHNSQFSISLLSPLAYFAGPALLVALPWYLKNFFFTGNPFYPFLSGLFGGVFWDQFRADWYAQAGTGIGFDLATLAGLPVLATLGVRDVNYFDGRTGPLFLAFLPLIGLYGLFRYRARAPERPPALDILLLFALAQFFFWALGVIWSRSLWQSRLLLPCLVALSPAVGWLWLDLAHLDWPGLSLRRFSNLLIGLALVLNLVELSLSFVQINPLAYLAGYESRAEYLTRRLGAYYAAMERLNQTLPPTAAVLFLWEPRSYFCQVRCQPDSILDQLAHDQYRYGQAAKIVAAWKKAGLTHVLLHRQGLNFIQAEDSGASYKPALEQLAALEAGYFEPVFDLAGAYQLYKLR